MDTMDHPIYGSELKVQTRKVGVAYYSGADSSTWHWAWLQRAHDGRGRAVGVGEWLWPATKQ